MAKELKIVAVGDGAVGKTSLLMVLNEKPFPERYVPTIFENYTQEVMINNEQYKLHIWDTAGQDEYDRLRPLSYRAADVILLCFALDLKQSFVNLTERWIGEVKHYCKDAKIILVGTKADLRQPGNANHVSDEEAKQFVNEQKCADYVPCSPKTGEGIDKVFPAAAKACKNQKKKTVCILI
ncbi:transforming protein RhoA-like [Histomonas meleagridis]|uniref:transforming protein RhoA-like n=1 Tax=Histomonas meleagridis TaxID=135588 RepID=UPI00355AA1A4|nr:transforming protein RhoA-like [Histomonas meleagridis]KAH0796371.1 transforming protein RhoA-like [Histomonas meleagridis]